MTAAIAWYTAPVIESVWNYKPLTAEQVAEREQSVHYSGCNEARADGAAPIYRGQPGYREEMDGDGDGIACEPHRGY
ncbi:excalibur calcium-binding domain-containing protein [Sphingomonas sp.]|uniref:excalibur calcium-binding domain-containing protein n=1 Tax=Sphingomonas sp. TaxID=28214 RepID=UPI0025F9374F|nr:excalibur calcium-binding domain-containing protein [Sphingomonas sp.]